MAACRFRGLGFACALCSQCLLYLVLAIEPCILRTRSLFRCSLVPWRCVSLSLVPWHCARFPWPPGAASRCSISFTGSCIVEPDRSPVPYWEELRPLQNPTRAPNCDQGLHCRTRLFTWTLFGSTWPGPIVQNPTQAQHCRTRPGPTVQNPT